MVDDIMTYKCRICNKTGNVSQMGYYNICKACYAKYKKEVDELNIVRNRADKTVMTIWKEMEKIENERLELLKFWEQQ